MEVLTIYVGQGELAAVRHGGEAVIVTLAGSKNAPTTLRVN